MEDEEWECARCTLCNTGSDGACAACGAARGAASASEASDSDGSGSESDGDYDMATGMDGPDEAAHTVEVHVAKRRWEETEARRVKARDEAVARAGGAAAASFDEKKAAQAQIFTSQACFRMLSEELFKIKNARAARLNAYAEGDDVHVWRVQLGAFTSATPLGAGLAELAARYPGCGADTVELRLRFKADLFPFFPPQVDVVRPRLLGLARGALVAHPLLRVAAWDPFTTCVRLLDRLRGFLEEHARVDVACAANDPRACPHGAHDDHLAQLDGALAQLAPLADLTPPSYAALYGEVVREPPPPGMPLPGAEAAAAAAAAASARAAPAVPEVAVPSSSVADMEAEGGEGADAASGDFSESADDDDDDDDDDVDLDAAGAGAEDAGAGGAVLTRKRKAVGTFWAKGTGYGHDGQGGSGEERWDPAKTAAAQAAQDEAQLRLARTAAELLGTLRDAPPPQPAQAVEIVTRSVLAAFLERELRGLSIMDVGARGAYYAALLNLIVAVAATPGAAAGFQGTAKMMAHIDAQARMFLRLSASALADPAEGAGATAAPTTTASRAQTAAAAVAAAAAAAEAAAAAAAAAAANVGESGAPSGTEDDFALARLVILASDALRDALAALQPDAPVDAAAAPASVRGARRGKQPAAAAASAASSGDSHPGEGGAAGPVDEAAEARAYCEALAPLALDCCALSGEHTYRGDARSDVPNAKQIRRVAKESAGLAALLPLTPSSSVFVRVDQACTSLWRALITGPEGTPYAGGCFIFDFFFPSAYPAQPPRVTLLTTGGGTVRFNPNLYNCGKVCLSLLGTWHGGKGEGWDPAVSSALQVLVSIQSLILVPQPVFNEPGYERQMGTPEGDDMNRNYNAPLMEATIKYAMLEPLRHPRAEFADAVRAHFRMRRAAILAECGGWLRNATPPHRASLEPLVGQLTAELAKL